MSCTPSCPCTPDMVDLAFRESEPFIDREIADRSYKMRRYLLDYAPVKIFPDGIGYEMTKVRFWGDIGPQFDGFEGWREEQRSRPQAVGQAPAHDACGYIWDEVGHGFEELHWRMMKRDIRTIPICIEDIRTFWEFQQYQNLIFQNLTEISSNIREQVNRNALLGFSVKHVVTSKGLEVNAANPYELPNISGVTLGKLGYRILKRIYTALIREAAMFALDTIDGRPVFGLMGSDDTIDDLFMEDPEIRQDIRVATTGEGLDAPLIRRYNFQDTIRGLFVIIPDNQAARYKADANGNLIRVFPYERDVPIQSGVRPAPNPEYDKAPFEYLQILTRDIFALRSRKAISTVGGETNFNAETGMFEWKWHNPERWCDPNRRKGFYFANGRIGIEPGDFTDAPGILVQRRPIALDPQFWPAATCPEDPVDCNNQLGAQGCPCPQVVGCYPVMDQPNYLTLVFSRAGVPASGTSYIDLSDGGVATVTVVSRSTDTLTAVINFGVPVVCDVNLYTQLHCADSDICSSPVVEDICNPNGDDDTEHTIRLELLLKTFSVGELGAVVSATLSDGSLVDFTVTAVDGDQITYTGTFAAALADGLCVTKLCIPPALDEDCPACTPSDVTCDPDTGLP